MARVTSSSTVPLNRALERPKPGNPRSDLHIAIARRLVERLPDRDIVAVLLAGSSTWGDADESSDVDLQILVDRPAPYREVTCIRIADLLGEAPPGGPYYVDLDRLSAAAYQEVATGHSGLDYRLVHGLILGDTRGFLADLQRDAIARFVLPASYRARFEAHRISVETERTGAREADAQSDATLARLRSRRMVEHAAASILDFADDRVSNHLVDAVVKGLALLGRADLGPAVLRAMAVDGGANGVDRALEAWSRFGDVSLAWFDDPAIGSRLNGEDRAWVLLNWNDAVVEEMEVRRDVLARIGKLPALQYYADNKLTVPVRISFGKYLSLIDTGQVTRQTVAQFHQSLRRLHSELFDEWVAGLRLDAPGPLLAESEVLADELLAIGAAELMRIGA